MSLALLTSIGGRDGDGEILAEEHRRGVVGGSPAGAGRRR